MIYLIMPNGHNCFLKNKIKMLVNRGDTFSSGRKRHKYHDLTFSPFLEGVACKAQASWQIAIELNRV